MKKFEWKPREEQCDICKCTIHEGESVFIVDDCEYFCGERCLTRRYSEKDYNEMYENDVAYWTELG